MVVLGLRPGYRRAYVRGAAQTARVVDRLATLARGPHPFLLLAHYMDSHRPYQTRRSLRDPGAAPSEAEAYRVAVRIVDEDVGALLATLRDAGLYDDALIVFTADHGEELSEDRLPGDYDHGHSLHRELLRVPLIVKLPGQRSAGMRRSDPASLIDVAPTVLAALGLPAPARFRGIDLLADTEPATERTLFAETLLQVPEQKSATRGDLTVLVESLPPRRSDAVAFDRSVDPEERDPLPIAADPRFEALFVALANHVAEANERGPRGRTPALDPQLRRDLEALGYAR